MSEATSTPRRRGRVRFTERAELLDFLLEVSTITSETLNLDELLANVAQLIHRVIPHELFAILLWSERVKGLKIRYAIGHREELVRNLVIGLGEGIVGAAAQERKPMLVPDVSKDPRYLPALDAVRAEMSVPMLVRGKLVGVIDIQSTRQAGYTQQDLAMLTLIASRIAVSIEHATLHRRVERTNRTLRLLAQLAQEFTAILELNALLDRIDQVLKDLIRYDAFSVLLLDEEAGMLRHRFSRRYDQRLELDDIPVSKGVSGAAVRTRQPVRVNDVRMDERYIAFNADIRSEVALPLIVQDRVIGVLDLESERIGAFTEEHVRTLGLLTPQIAVSVENARLYEQLALRERSMAQDLLAGQRVQSVLLPRATPPMPHLESAIRFRPARTISGDIYDFFEHAHDSMTIAFGDSSGKGAAASLYGAMVSGLLRSVAPRRRSPSMLLKTLNDELMERRVEAQYVALLVALWTGADQQLVMANAGALPPLICRRGKLLRPRPVGMPLGMMPNQDYEELAVITEVGDVILFYSDGYEDQTNAAGEVYGQDRLPAALLRLAESSAEEIAAALERDLDEFRGDCRVHDDQTLLVLKVI
jgi:sigma-B regulation protein RsbU (phosphoserine phosphatase)